MLVAGLNLLSIALERGADQRKRSGNCVSSRDLSAMAYLSVKSRQLPVGGPMSIVILLMVTAFPLTLIIVTSWVTV